MLPLLLLLLLVHPGTVEADAEVYARCHESHRVLIVARLRSRGKGRRRRSWHRPLKYGSPKFEELADFARAFYGALDTEERRWGMLLSDWRRSLRTMDAVVRLPVVEVTFTSSPAGQTLQQFYRRRRFFVPTGRVAQAVLDVMPSRDDYLRGRSRQALRTNVRKASAHGITCANCEPEAWSKEAATVAGALPLALPESFGCDALLLCARHRPRREHGRRIQRAVGSGGGLAADDSHQRTRPHRAVGEAPAASPCRRRDAKTGGGLPVGGRRADICTRTSSTYSTSSGSTR